MNVTKSLVMLWGVTMVMLIPACATNKDASPSTAPHIGMPLNNETRSDFLFIEHSLTNTPLISGTFIQTKKIEGLNKPFISEGNFIFCRDRGVYWNTSTPLPSLFVFTEKGTLQAVDGETQFVSAESQPFYNSLRNLMQALREGDVRSLEQYFQIFFSGKQGDWQLRLVAKEKRLRKAISEIVISGNQHIRSIDISDARNNTTLIIFENLKTPEKLNPNESKYFDVPADI